MWKPCSMPMLGRFLRTLLPALLAIGALLVFASASQAATYTVSTTAGDSSAGSLREAVGLASSGDTIAFAPSLSGRIRLDGGTPIVVDKNLTINGPGAGTLAIDGRGTTAILSVASDAALTISGLTLRSGFSASSGAAITNEGTGTLSLSAMIVTLCRSSGLGLAAVVNAAGGALDVTDSSFTSNVNDAGAPAISNTAALTITNSSFTSNQGGVHSSAVETTGDTGPVSITDTQFGSNHGGGSGVAALYINGAAPVTVTGSSFSGNGNDDQGAALLVDGLAAPTIMIDETSFTGNHGGRGVLAIEAPATVNITDSVVANNGSSTAGGGGILITSSTEVTIERTTIRGNVSGKGAGIYQSSGSPLTIVDSTISGNTALTGGGGLFLTNGGTATIVNSTFSGNADGSWGGAITSFGVPLDITSSTITENSGYNAGGIVIDGALTLRNSIVAANVGGSASDLFCTEPATLTDANLVGTDDAACPFSDESQLIKNVDALLGPLRANNLGTTSQLQTHALLPGSPAIDAATGDATPTTDERGVARPQGATADLGAFEVRPAALVLAISAPVAAGVTGPVVYVLTAANHGDVDAADALITDPLPTLGTVQLVTFDSADAGCAQVSGTVTCALGVLAANSSTERTINTTAAAPGIAENMATLEATGPADATASATTTITGSETPPNPTPDVRLDVTLDGPGSGSVDSLPGGIACGDDCSEDYPQGSVIVLRARPGSDSRLTGWLGCTPVPRAPSWCSVELSQAASVHATFAKGRMVTAKIWPKVIAQGTAITRLAMRSSARGSVRLTLRPCRDFSCSVSSWGRAVTRRVPAGRSGLRIATFGLRPGRYRTTIVVTSRGVRSAPAHSTLTVVPHPRFTG